MLNHYWQYITHDIRITCREAYSWLTPLLFFVIVTCLFPLAIDSNPLTLKKIAPGILWVTALLAILMSIGNLFRQDAAEGFLDQLLLSRYPLTLLVSCKILSHWLTHCLPLIIISPLLGFLLNLSHNEIDILIITLLIGTPILSLIGAIGAALTVGIRSHGLLLPILIMPFYIPVLIFGTGTMMAATFHQPISGDLAFMGAYFLLCLAFAPYFTGLALRIGVNQ